MSFTQDKVRSSDLLYGLRTRAAASLEIKQTPGNPRLRVFFISRTSRRISNNQKHLNHFKESAAPHVRLPAERGERAIRFISGEKEERMEGEERGGREEEKRVLYPEQSI